MPSIDSALFSLLGNSLSLDNFTPSRLLSERIEFVTPLKKDSYMEHLRMKYAPINNLDKPSLVSQTKSQHHHELYPKDKIDLRWKQKRSIGCGLVNPANTCYLNSTLQCLLYTPPLINYLLLDHKKTCRGGGFCVSCSLLQLYNTVNNSNGGACRPSSFIHHLKMIAKHFCFGRQEDAHEFLIHLRDKMIQQFLNSHPKIDNNKKDTTPTHAVFGGKLVSTVTCSQCSHQSNTNECFLELGLDVRHSESIHQSFNKLCKRETLSGSNSYKCEKCKRSVIATKQFRISETPNVLVLHLKRFQFGGFTGKLKNQIKFPEFFDISNWTKQKVGHTKYSLYGVLVHAGSSAQCGHYYCFVKAPSGSWHCMNDTSVNTVSLQRVLNSEAYLLFYLRHENSLSNGQSSKNGHPASHVNGGTSPKVNGTHKVRLMDSNPFYKDPPKPSPKPLSSQRPVKFNFTLNSKTKNPYLPKTSPNSASFIGPLLPNGTAKSNGTSSKHQNCHVQSPSQPNSNQKVSEQKSPSKSVVDSLSSLDILKNTYKDDSSEEDKTFNPNATPVLSIKKKGKPLSSESNGAKKEKAGNVFERLGMKAGVKSWTGGNSKNFESDNKVWKSIGNTNKRPRDEYDEGLDQGRVKKVKQQKHNHLNGNGKHEFQRVHEFNKQKKWEDKRNTNNHSNGKSPKYFWKNKKHK